MEAAEVHAYEYLFSALIVASMLLASIFMLKTSIEPAKVASERENLKAIAQAIFTQILLSPGNPEDWGINFSVKSSLDLNSFGLAPKSRVTKEVYVLDADKISRLNEMNPFFLSSPSHLRELLGLGPEYGFTIEILPALDVKVSMKECGQFRVEVKSIYGGAPVSNANVTAKIYYLDESGQIKGSPAYSTTDYVGTCIIDFGSNLKDPYVAVFVVNYSNMRVMEISTSRNNTRRLFLTGKILCFDGGKILGNEVLGVVAPSRNGADTIEDIKLKINEYSIGGSTYYEISQVEPQLITVLATTEDRHLALVDRRMNITYGTVTPSNSPPLGFITEKIVLIDGFSYIIRLYIWRLIW
jgi:hypothetical protein